MKQGDKKPCFVFCNFYVIFFIWEMFELIAC